MQHLPPNAALKQDLAARFPDNRSAYTDGKSAFVARVLAACPPPASRAEAD